ncbi:MAG TPA: hypothetical protein VGX03_07410 [Candidatus Binatia bacterium]|jgi:hypothetical protein|nr:hypothetical protein [Candidatus Binatia bacterium]
MKRSAATGAILVFSFASCAVIEAADLFTSHLLVGGSNIFQCRILNVSTDERTVQMRIKNAATGATVNTIKQTLAGGRGTASFIRAAEGGEDFYCQFTVSGRKANYRAVGCTAAAGGIAQICIPAE